MKRLIACLIALVSFNALALETNFSAKKITKDMMGKEIKVSAETLVPGEVIEYNFQIYNNGTSKEFELRPSIPIPSEMTLVEGKMDPGIFDVSVDGTSYMSYPVLDKEGEPVHPSAYKRVRWYIEEIKPEEIINVSLRAKLNE